MYTGKEEKEEQSETTEENSVQRFVRPGVHHPVSGVSSLLTFASFILFVCFYLLTVPTDDEWQDLTSELSALLQGREGEVPDCDESPFDNTLDESEEEQK